MDTLKTQLAASATKLIPESSQPQWYFAFLVLGGVLAVVGTRWVDSRKRRSRAEPPTETFPVKGGNDQRPTNCGEHDRRLERLEGDVGDIYELIRDSQLASERRLTDLLRQFSKDQHEENQRFQREMRDEVKKELAATENRVSQELERVVANIGNMFLKTQDGVGVSGQIPH